MIKIVRICVLSSILFLAFTANTLANETEVNSMLLNETEITTQLQTLPGWTSNGKEITHTFKFPDFIAAINFVNKLVEPAEAAGHHPDIFISYNKVTITLTTHDAGGLTQKDLDLAQTITAISE